MRSVDLIRSASVQDRGWVIFTMIQCSVLKQIMFKTMEKKKEQKIFNRLFNKTSSLMTQMKVPE